MVKNIEQMKYSKKTIAFLKTLDEQTKDSILTNIANHYGCSNEKAYAEITDEDAECIMDYVTGSMRSCIHLYYKKFLIRFNNSLIK